MPEEKKEVPMVDIDTSGPDAEIELQDEANESSAVETTEDINNETVAAEASDSLQEASDEKDEKKEELESYSKDVQRRIAKLTKKYREAERQRDEALQFAKSQIQKSQELGKRYSSLESISVREREAKINAALEAAKSKLAQVRESGDLNAEVELNREIARLGYEEGRLQEYKAAYEAHKANMEKNPQQADYFAKKQQIAGNNLVPKDLPTDPKAETWASKNRWFGTDKAMTYTAFDIHRQLVDEEGYDPKSDEYYEEVNKRIRLEFPHKFVNNSENKEEVSQASTIRPSQTVASATRSVKSSRKTIRLTPTEVAIAKKLGVSLEDYAKQKQLMKEVK